MEGGLKNSGDKLFNFIHYYYYYYYCYYYYYYYYYYYCSCCLLIIIQWYTNFCGDRLDSSLSLSLSLLTLRYETRSLSRNKTRDSEF